MDIAIRSARAGDYAAVSRILAQVQRLHVELRPDIYKPNDRLLPAEVFAVLAEKGTFFVAEAEGKVVGIMEIMFRHVENPAQCTRDVLYIDTMAVDEPYRGRGVGHKFFEHAKRIRDERGLDGIELQVNSRNAAALGMYEKYGFTVKTYYMELTE